MATSGTTLSLHGTLDEIPQSFRHISEGRVMVLPVGTCDGPPIFRQNFKLPENRGVPVAIPQDDRHNCHLAFLMSCEGSADFFFPDIFGRQEAFAHKKQKN